MRVRVEVRFRARVMFEVGGQLIEVMGCYGSRRSGLCDCVRVRVTVRVRVGN